MLAALEFSLPGRSDRLVPEVELDPGKVRTWLASLPLLNVAAGGRKLYTALNAYNRTEIDPERRLELLELFRVPIKHIVAELQKQYTGLPLPLPEKHKSAAEQHRDFQRELAFGYKYVVLADAARERSPAATALPVQRALHHSTEVLLASYLSYSPYPEGLWREIHALYTHAERLGVTVLPVEDSLHVAGKTTVAAAYKRALLLDLADPYHLPSRMVAKINQYLECYADLASLHRGFERVEPNCHFLIDLASDRAGILYSQDTALEQPQGYCLLNTVELARHIHAQLTSFRGGGLPACRVLAPEYYKSGGEEMLLRLINVWGLNPKRTFRRNQRQNAKVDLAVGLDAINYWLNGGRRFVLSAELLGPFQQRTNIGVFAKTHEEAQHGTDHQYATWDVQDESAGGMSLRKIGTVHRRVKVGDLIATRFERNEGWAVAVVRWVKSPNSSRVEIGTQRLAPSAQPVVIKVVGDNNEESDFLPALLLPAVPALNEPATLVTPGNIFRPDRIIYMDNGRQLNRVYARELIESASAFERIAFVADPAAT